MKTRKLGFSDLEITRIGLGTWAIGGADWAYAWGPQDDAVSVRTIHKAIDVGINWIDTAAVYGIGHSEEVVGKAIAGRRDKVLIATKCGRLLKEGSTTIIGSLKAKSVREELEASLRRLGTDYVDLYQIHWPDPDPDIEEGWTEIARQVKAGRIRYAGVSNFTVSQIKRLQKIHPVASLQPPYSMLRRDVEAELLPFCAANAIGVIVYSPMQAGLLTGTFTKERARQLPDSDWRKRSPYFAEPALSANLELVEKLKAIAGRKGRSVAEIAIAWVLRRPEVTAAIVGGRGPEQVEQTRGGADLDLTPAEIAEIDARIAEREAKRPS
jgi:aryl-alcohol dehydrogenase-like predicted oxidoreductase